MRTLEGITAQKTNHWARKQVSFLEVTLAWSVYQLEGHKIQCRSGKEFLGCL